MIKCNALALGLLFALLPPSLLAADAPGAAPASEISFSPEEQQEIDLGETIAARVVGVAPLFANSRLQAYVNGIGRWLSLQTERPDLPWKFGVLGNDSGYSFSTPGGYVFITTGILKHVTSEAELAGLLAHEMAHVLKKHQLATIRKAVPSETGQPSQQAMEKAVDAGMQIYANGLDKNDEFEADAMAVVIMARSGYDPYGLPAVLHALSRVKPNDNAVALMSKTFPAPFERLQRLENLMAGNLDKYSSQQVLGDRFAVFAASSE